MAIYNSFKGKFSADPVDWLNNDIKVMLVTSSYVPDYDTHTVKTHVTNEVVGDGYTAGGALLYSKTITIDTTNNLAKYDGADSIWPNSTINARGAVIYKANGTAPLIAYIDFITDKASAGSDFKIQWNINGILTIA